MRRLRARSQHVLCVVFLTAWSTKEEARYFPKLSKRGSDCKTETPFRHGANAISRGRFHSTGSDRLRQQSQNRESDDRFPQLSLTASFFPIRTAPLEPG